MSLEDDVDHVISTVSSERALAANLRTSGASDRDLDLVGDLLVQIARVLSGDRSAARTYKYPYIARIVNESWSSASPLANELAEVERSFLHLQNSGGA